VISFRYHVFTVAAIFLAVALGIAVGNAYVQPALVSRLEQQTIDLQQRLADQERLIRATDVLPVLVNDDLAGHHVVVVTHTGVDDGSMNQVRRALEAAGAQLTTSLAVTEKLSATEVQDRETLADLFGMSSTDDPAPLVERAVEVIADRLTEGPPRRGAPPGDDDVLDQLLRGAFLSLADGSERDLESLGGNGELFVVVAGGDDEPAPSIDEFLVPFVEELVARGATVAAAESAGTAYPFVEALRADDAVAGRIVTVDDVDLSIGGTALVLGLERLVVLGQGGDYGYQGSDGPIPPP
jgi:hypothetical protein